MSSRKQRMKNRATARELRTKAAPACQRCGVRGQGYHWVGLGLSLFAWFNGEQEPGFWTCPDLYGEDGRRIDTSDSPFSL